MVVDMIHEVSSKGSKIFKFAVKAFPGDAGDVTVFFGDGAAYVVRDSEGYWTEQDMLSFGDGSGFPYNYENAVVLMEDIFGDDDVFHGCEKDLGALEEHGLSYFVEAIESCMTELRPYWTPMELDLGSEG